MGASVHVARQGIQQSGLYAMLCRHALKLPLIPERCKKGRSFGPSVMSDRLGERLLRGNTMTVVSLLLSGGLDLMVALQLLQRSGASIEAVFLAHGQAAAENEEIASAKIASHFGVRRTRLSIAFPHSFGVGEIPYRNGFFVFAGAMIADGKPTLSASAYTQEHCTRTATNLSCKRSTRLSCTRPQRLHASSPR